MSIELLNKAATAAGYAMATPDDDAVDDHALEIAEARTQRATVGAEQRPARLAADEDGGLAGWLKGFLPAFGWRLPA